MPLVKRRHCQIAHRKVRGEAIVKGEVDGVVVDALVLVPIIELQVEIQAAISGVEGSVERRGVKVLDWAGGVGGAEAEPHEEGSEAQSEDEAAAAAAASASGLRHGGRWDRVPECRSGQVWGGGIFEWFASFPPLFKKEGRRCWPWGLIDSPSAVPFHLWQTVAPTRMTWVDAFANEVTVTVLNLRI